MCRRDSFGRIIGIEVEKEVKISFDTVTEV